MNVQLLYRSEFDGQVFRKPLTVPEEFDCVRIMKELVDGLYKQRHEMTIGINYKMTRIAIYDIIKVNNRYDLYKLVSVQTERYDRRGVPELQSNSMSC